MDNNLSRYFNNMFKSVDKNIKLDEDQIKAITSDAKHTLVLAGAGTGKTTTMVAKVKYLVDIKKVDPSRILVISYTKNAVNELKRIINDHFKINCTVTTFHSLGYSYIRKIFNGYKCYVVDNNEKEEIFIEYLNKLYKEDRIDDLVTSFTAKATGNKYLHNSNFFNENYSNYTSYTEFYEAYKKQAIEDAKSDDIKKVIKNHEYAMVNDNDHLYTIKGDIVKSAGEVAIANFLYKNGINYEYERIYTKLVKDDSVYKPDFTIEYNGKKIYLEYFGLNNKTYNDIKKKKIEMHKQEGNIFISIDRGRFEVILVKLDEELKKLGVIYHPLSDEEILSKILDLHKLRHVFMLRDLLYDNILLIKGNPNRERYQEIFEQYLSTHPSEIERKQYEIINDFYIFYNKKCYEGDKYGFDFSDMLFYANKYFHTHLKNKELYDYIIIDEYQDISDDEYNLAKNTASVNDSAIFTVGDDWQTIYSFRGSNIKYITKFEKYFSDATLMSINKTYRHSQEIVDISSTFIRRNKDQLKKNLISDKMLNKALVIKKYDDFVGYEPKSHRKIYDPKVMYNKLEEVIIGIHKIHPRHKILILARNNNMIEAMHIFNHNFIDAMGSRVKIKTINDVSIDAMTIHKSKGLTYDEVIIIGLDKRFPSDYFFEYWFNLLFKPDAPIESIDYPEERRLFYVALTRTKNHVFILASKDPDNRSSFVDEIEEIRDEIITTNEKEA
ncbi:MAG: UvrD-helicase domain-containing protein [Bacilli bacterium]|nr:UvrD-helicase domain-containing protein [Bacilli bacterium]